MKTTLIFGDDELDQARMSANGVEAHYALDAIDEQCRQWIKHQELTDEEEKRLDLVRGMVQDFRYQD